MIPQAHPKNLITIKWDENSEEVLKQVSSCNKNLQKKEDLDGELHLCKKENLVGFSRVPAKQMKMKMKIS